MVTIQGRLRSSYVLYISADCKGSRDTALYKEYVEEAREKLAWCKFPVTSK
jgi:hypothetical protein